MKAAHELGNGAPGNRGSSADDRTSTPPQTSSAPQSSQVPPLTRHPVLRGNLPSGRPPCSSQTSQERETRPPAHSKERTEGRGRSVGEPHRL